MNTAEVAWVEKYRPDNLDQIRGNPIIVDRFKDWVDDPSMPNIMLAGQQGIGKTAMAVAFAKEKYGQDDWKNYVLQLNASDERGIDTVRNRIKDQFAQMSMVGDEDYKIVILDESDALTNDAQTAMRRVMEDYADITRFFLLCNYPNKLIDPIQSRCSVFRMKPLPEEELIGLLAEVCEGEGVSYEEEQLEYIADSAGGDARASIQMLQGATVDDTIETDYVDVMVRGVNESEVQDIVSSAVAGDAEYAMEKLDELIEHGVAPQELCEALLSAIEDNDTIPEDAKASMGAKVGTCEWRLINGSSPHTQLHWLIAHLRLARYVSLDTYREEAKPAGKETI
jgi:replication factor C small subunit